MPVGIFFDCEHASICELHIAIATGTCGQGLRRTAIQRLSVQLLIGLVDENYAVITQAKSPAAVLVDPAAHAETRGRQTMGLTVVPVPDATGRIGGTVFIPEQTQWANSQLGEIDPGGHRECGAKRFSLLR